MKLSWQLCYAGNEVLSVFRIDPHRSSEAAKNLLGDKLDGLLVTDACAAYNAIDCAGGRPPGDCGNASSEVRMWICGALGHHRKETGILEEIQLANLARNPEGSYSVWDSVLFEFATMTPGLTTLLNCSVNNAGMQNGHLASVDAWQMTTQS